MTDDLIQLLPPPLPRASAVLGTRAANPLRVALVLMPFYDLVIPALGIGQLAAIVNGQLVEIATAETIYANHTLASRLGVDFHQSVYDDPRGRTCGLGDWLFRQVAFPEAPDNADEYMARYYDGNEHRERREQILTLRPQLERLCSELIDEHGLDGYDVVGFSSMFQQTVPSLAVARLLKERRPEIITAIGGANCEAPMGPALIRNAPMLDYVFSGSALKSFPAFLRLAAAAPDRCPERLPRGVFGRDTPSTQANQFGEELPLTEYIRPDYRSFVTAFEETRRENSELAPVIAFETSRGCWWGQRSHCTFCGLNGSTMDFRKMRPELAIELIHDLFADYYPWCKVFAACDNIMPEEYMAEVFPRIQAPEDAEIFYEVRVKNLERETLRGLARARVGNMQPGIESIYTPTLKRMAKGTTSFDNLRFLLNCLDFGIDTQWNLLTGFPGEDDASYRHYLRSIPLLRHIQPPGGVGVVRFDRYSPYFTKAEEYGLDLRPAGRYGAIFPFDSDSLYDLAYDFEDAGPAPYARTLESFLPKLRQAVEDWEESFYKQEAVLIGEPAPDGVAIYDTRSGDAIEYRLEGAAAKLLLRLHQPARLDRISTDQQPALEELVSRGLVFTDVGRVMSIVSWGEDFVPTVAAKPSQAAAPATA